MTVPFSLFPASRGRVAFRPDSIILFLDMFSFLALPYPTRRLLFFPSSLPASPRHHPHWKHFFFSQLWWLPLTQPSTSTSKTSHTATPWSRVRTGNRGPSRILQDDRLRLLYSGFAALAMSLAWESSDKGRDFFHELETALLFLLP